MSFEAFRTFFALLALIALAGALASAVALVQERRGGGRVADEVLGAVAGSELKLAFVVALTATLGSLYLSEIAHLEPCRLCWFQRIAMYPLAVVLGMAAWRNDRSIRPYGMTIAGIGAAIAGYHYLIQRFPNLEAGACEVGVPCSAAYFYEFGFISIPFLALSGFLTIGAILMLHAANERRAASSKDRQSAPQKASTT